jgi:hypothetical protein
VEINGKKEICNKLINGMWKRMEVKRKKYNRKNNMKKIKKSNKKLINSRKYRRKQKREYKSLRVNKLIFCWDLVRSHQMNKLMRWIKRAKTKNRKSQFVENH